jgi:hypothetical protein
LTYAASDPACPAQQDKNFPQNREMIFQFPTVQLKHCFVYIESLSRLKIDHFACLSRYYFFKNVPLSITFTQFI